MKRLERLVSLAALVAAIGACPVDGVPPKPVAANTLTGPEKAAGWRLLFDGETTTGWRNYGKPTISDGWKVQDSALTRVGAGGDIITSDEFKNFELSID